MTRPDRPDATRRPPRAIDAARLQRAALRYLERYATSSENLRRVLERRIARTCRLRGEDASAFQGLAETVVQACIRAGLVDDRAYAGGQVASLRRKGLSGRAIQARLAAKGLDRDLTGEALQAHPATDADAAWAFARRRRLGPFRRAARGEHRDRDMAAMGRAGFAWPLARAVVDAADEDVPEALRLG